MHWQPAGDIYRRLERIIRALGLTHVDPSRVHCVRVHGSRANALARIWGLPPIFQDTLQLPAHYVIEFMTPSFERLPADEQDRVIIHELLHIPRTFSGGIRPERSPSLTINNRTVERYYRQYLQYLAAMTGRRRTRKGRVRSRRP